MYMNKNVNFLDKNLFEIINIIDGFLKNSQNKFKYFKYWIYKNYLSFYFLWKNINTDINYLIIQNFYLNKRKFLYN